MDVLKIRSLIEDELNKKDPDEVFKPASEEEQQERLPAIAKEALAKFGGKIKESSGTWSIWLQLETSTKDSIFEWLRSKGLDPIVVEPLSRYMDNLDNPGSLDPYVKARKTFQVYVVYYIKDKTILFSGDWDFQF